MSRGSILAAVETALSPRPAAPALPAFLDPPVFEDLAEAFLKALHAAGGTGEVSSDPARIEGATEADYGIAETGTVVEVSGPERSRLASLLPESHLVVLPIERLRAGLGEVLTIGVHGPARLHVVLVPA